MLRSFSPIERRDDASGEHRGSRELHVHGAYETYRPTMRGMIDEHRPIGEVCSAGTTRRQQPGEDAADVARRGCQSRNGIIQVCKESLHGGGIRFRPADRHRPGQVPGSAIGNAIQRVD